MLFVLAASFVKECIVDWSTATSALPSLPGCVAFLQGETLVGIDVDRLQLVDHIGTRGHRLLDF